MNKKIAINILAHAYPEHLERLVSALDYKNFEIFIHLDAKALKDKFPKDCNYIYERINCSWGTFSLVEASLSLLKESYCEDFENYILISGQEYPIWSNPTIYSKIMESDLQYIDVFQSEEKHWHNRYTKFYITPKTKKDCFFKKIMESRIRNYLPARKMPLDMTPYFGSQWWSLNKESVNKILSFVKNNPALIHFFRKTRAPDEMFFQTIGMNLGLITNKGHKLSLAMFEDKNPNPKVLTELSDLEILSKSVNFFARKFTENSTMLLNSIDSHLRIR